MKILIDTHCWLWLQTTPERLAPAALAALENTDNRLFLSVASAWEIVIKHTIGKLPLPIASAEYVATRLADSDIDALPICLHHTLAVANLPLHHRDPFDRMLIGQARSEEATLLTADRVFVRYDVDTIRATKS